VKKFLLLSLFMALLFSCSSDDFKEPKLEDFGVVGSTKGTVTCRVGNSCFEISESACNIIGGEQRSDEKCINFTCKWSPKKVKYGEKSTLVFQLDSTGQEACSWEISYGSLPLHEGTNYTISAYTFSGLPYSKDTSIIANAIVTCKNQTVSRNCEKLEIDSVPGPKITGGLSFKIKPDYFSNDTNYFSIGKTISVADIDNTIKITNKNDVNCSEIEIEIDGIPAALGTPIKATAYVTCDPAGKLDLASISAEVLPDPIIGDCKFTGNSKSNMRSIDTLTVGMEVDSSSDYGRCKEVEYTFDGSNYTTSNSFALATYANKDLTDVKASVTCGTKRTVKDCPKVSVTNYKYSKTCTDGTYDIDIDKGKTIIVFACSKWKSGKNENGDDQPYNAYYINCGGKDYKLSVSGGREVQAPGNGLSYNFYPDVEEPAKVDDLYIYPYDIIIETEEDLTCGIW